METVELYFEPRTEALKKISNYPGEPEMTEFETAYLCGLIKTYRPEKILEIGVAGGATTAIILQCLDMLGLSETSQLISADLCKKFYVDPQKKTGFLADEYKSKVNKVRHKEYLGNVVAANIDQIGYGIDMVIIDTTHAMPGENLDFLTVLPYLKENCIVVLHDIALNHVTGSKNALSTLLLYNSVTAKKLYMFDSSREYEIPNIGAFLVDPSTKENIEDIFRTLLVTWTHLPSDKDLAEYRGCLQKNYTQDMMAIYDAAVDLNKRLIFKRPESYKFRKRIRYMARMLIRGY